MFSSGMMRCMCLHYGVESILPGHQYSVDALPSPQSTQSFSPASNQP